MKKKEKELCASISTIQAKLNFIKSCNLDKLSAEHREKVLNAVKACNIVLDLILEKK